MTEPNMEMHAAEQEKMTRANLAEALQANSVSKARGFAEQLKMPNDVFVRTMMDHATYFDINEAITEIELNGAAAEFLASPETQAAARRLMERELDAHRVAAALDVIVRFRIPEQIFTAEIMQEKMKGIALATMTRGDSSGAVALVKQGKIDDVFLRSDEMRQAALVCRDILAKKVSASVVARRIQLEKDFDLPPME